MECKLGEEVAAARKSLCYPGTHPPSHHPMSLPCRHLPEHLGGNHPFVPLSFHQQQHKQQIGVRRSANTHPNIHTCTPATVRGVKRIHAPWENVAQLSGQAARPSREAGPAPTSRSQQQIRSEVGRATLLSASLRALPIPAQMKLQGSWLALQAGDAVKPTPAAPASWERGRMRLRLGNLPEHFSLLSWTVPRAAAQKHGLSF